MFEAKVTSISRTVYTLGNLKIINTDSSTPSSKTFPITLLHLYYYPILIAVYILLLSIG